MGATLAFWFGDGRYPFVLDEATSVSHVVQTVREAAGNRMSCSRVGHLFDLVPRLGCGSARNQSSIPIGLMLSASEVGKTGLDCRRSAERAPLRPQWPHRTGDDADARARRLPLSFAHVGVGMMIPPSATFLAAAASQEAPLDASTTSLQARCAARTSEPLACALATWAAHIGSTLEVLLLVDCLPLCEGGREASHHPPSACAISNRSSRFGDFAHYPFAVPPWLLRANGTLSATIHLRCFWGKSSGRGIATHVEKGAALLRALHTVLPAKNYFVKLDLDAALWPPALFRLLNFLHERLPWRSAVYFGSTTLGSRYGQATTTWEFERDSARLELLRALEAQPGTPVLRNRSKQRRFAEQAAARGLAHMVQAMLTPKQKEMLRRGALNASAIPRRVHVRPFILLRETSAWRALAAVMMPPAEASAADEVMAVRFAQGSLYGLSHTALAALVDTDCMRRVSALDHELPVRRAALQRCEDAAVGLCMHLLRVPFVDTACIVGAVVGQTHVAHDLLKRVPHACRRPIAVHPLKDAKEYLQDWDHFKETERYADYLAGKGWRCGSSEKAATL